jgi:hypothetical protein
MAKRLGKEDRPSVDSTRRKSLLRLAAAKAGDFMAPAANVKLPSLDGPGFSRAGRLVLQAGTLYA